MIRYLILACASLMIASCNDNPEIEAQAEQYVNDAHSFSNPNEVAISHLDLSLEVDFESRQLKGEARYRINRSEGNILRLDVRDMAIQSVELGHNGAEGPAQYEVLKGDDYGDVLEIQLGPEAIELNIAYITQSDAAALLWLDSTQTHDKQSPFMFTQGQAILTRSWIPIQDSPSIRITYEATVSVPQGMLALMSAENPTALNDSSVYRFKMDKPIPPYLMALAVGEVEFQSLGSRTGVYAEPGLLAEAAYEFEDMEAMLEVAEELYGPYAWGRYDVLVLPPSFPFGGMENPMLTFATPTIIAGDKSLTSLIAHELAHSWSGNLVTNASWNDFWLNEGFTVYFEKRIVEALYGRDYAEMLNVLGYQDLMATIDELGVENPDTHLKLDLEGRDPDDGLTDIAYEKGYFFLRWLEERTGRETFDTFLKEYFENHAFQTMTTSQFVEYLDANLLQDLDNRPDVEAWIYAPGMPTDHPMPHSALFEAVDSLSNLWVDEELSTSELPFESWSTHERLHFLRGIPDNLGTERITELDAAFGLSTTGNAEIATAWFLFAIPNNYSPAMEPLEAFLIEVGRRKFVQPLYEAMAQDADLLIEARRIFTLARPNYHAITTGTVDGILNYSSVGSAR